MLLRRFSTATGVVLLALMTRESRAQDLSGTVQNAETSSPISGAVVMLLDQNRRTVARTLTSAMGAFRLRRDGATTLRVIRIGFSPHEAPAPASGPVVVNLTPLSRTTLRPVVVTTRPVCPARSDQREALETWSSATDAMLAMIVASSEETQSGTVTQLLYNRFMGVDGRRIVRQSVKRVVTDNVTPIRADRAPDEFVQSGYVVQRGNVSTYHGPDPEVLLDSSFAATHCLSVRTDRARPGEVGVAFSPPSNRTGVPDIAGVLWLTQSPMSLKSLTFEYRGVDRAVMDMRAGGQLEFETMSNGVPVIRSWHVRSPKLRFIPSGRMVGGRAVVQGAMADVIEVHETGGLIADGRLPDGTPIVPSLASLGGRVMNVRYFTTTIRTGERVQGARVTLDSTDYDAVSDTSGEFTFEGVLPGPYTVRVRDSVVISTTPADTAPYGTRGKVQQVVWRIATVPIEARLGRESRADVRLPWRATVNGCGPTPETERPRFTVFGYVQATDSAPLPNARVRLSWTDSAGAAALETAIDAVASNVGEFVMCGIPAGRDLVTRVVSTQGAEFDGKTRVPYVIIDERTGRPVPGNLRFVTIVVEPVVKPPPR